MAATSAVRPHDLTRQIVMISATTFMLIGAVVGNGLLGGTSVQNLQNGALDTNASFLAPARSAFSIWSVIYLGLIVYTVWQALPRQRANTRQRAIGWWIALTAVLNGLWLVTAQFGTLLMTVIGIAVLLAALCVTFRRTIAYPREGVVDAILIDGVTGLHLGWVTLATVANVTAWLTQAGVAGSELWGVAVLVVVAAIGIGIGIASRGRFAPALALSWGLSWLAVARLTGEPHSPAIGVAAIVVAVLIIVTPFAALPRRVSRSRPVLA